MAAQLPQEPGPPADLPDVEAPLTQREELLSLRRELAGFSRAVRKQLQSHEERQERLLVRLEQAAARPRPCRRVIVSLDGDDTAPATPPISPRKRQRHAEPVEEECAARDFAENVREAETATAAPALADAAPPQGEEDLAAGMADSARTRPGGLTRTSVEWSAWQAQVQEAPQQVEGVTQFKTEELRAVLGDSAWRVVGRWIDWWMELKEPNKDGFLARVVMSRAFEATCTVVAALNSVLIVYITNYEARHLEENSAIWVWLVNLAFVLFYSMELGVKVSVHRLFFFCNEDASWNIFDAVLVALAFLDLLPSRAGKGETATHMRTLRALRILRATKGLRLFRVMRYFSTLRMLLSSVLNSLVSLFWAIVMLACMLCMFALTFVQSATLAQMMGNLTEQESEGLRAILGSTEEAMLTLLLSTTGGESWGPIFQRLQLTGEWNCALFLFYIAFVQLAVLNILTGVFVEHALKLAQPDHETAALEQRKEELEEAEELRALIASMDSQHTGVISEDQFVAQLRSEQFRARLALLGLEIRHAELFFESICTDYGKKEVSIEAFVAGAMRLKGSASALDLQTLTFGTKLIHESQSRFFKSLNSRLEAMSEQMRVASPCFPR